MAGGWWVVAGGISAISIESLKHVVWIALFVVCQFVSLFVHLLLVC